MIKPNSMAWDYKHKILPTRKLQLKLKILSNKASGYMNHYAPDEEAEYHNRINDPEYKELIDKIDSFAFKIVKLSGF